MQLTHEFTVPASITQTWDVFNDIEGMAGCFPGATVSAAEGDSFEGSVKVKLGPIALVYRGSGSFTEKDEIDHRLVIDAKGKDKRGNGTASAGVVTTMTALEDVSTRVSVVTDLNITGKPAQFGRGVMQDVSDKLLAQFADCLAKRLTDPVVTPPDQDAGPASVPTGAAAQAAPGGDPDAGPASVPQPAAMASAATGTPTPAAGPTRAPADARTADASSPLETSRPTAAPNDDALDLGATVLPVLLKSYWRQALGVVIGSLLLRRLLRRRKG